MSMYTRIKRSGMRFLRQAIHRPKAKISRSTVLVASILTLIFITALLIRLLPLIDAQPIVRAFDPWYQLKVTKYIVENGYGAFFNWYDDTVWQPFGRNLTEATYIGVPFTSAFFYFVLTGLGIDVDVTMVSIIMPAFMGAITTIVAFFLGREISNNSVGLLSALFMGYMPAYLQRTMTGFYDNECVGVFAIVLALFFFVRSIKRDSLPSAVAAGVALGYLLGSWGASSFLLDLFAMYAFLMLVGGRYSRQLMSTYLITISLGLFMGNLVPRNGFRELTSFGILVPIGVAGLLAAYEIWLRVAKYRASAAVALAPHMRPLLLGLTAPLLGVGGYFLYTDNLSLSITTASSTPFLTLGAKFLTVINPFFRLDQRIFASVAEHLPTPWASFYNVLSTLIFFFPLGLYFVFRRGRDEDWMIFLYGVTSVYFAGSMIRLGLILAPGVAVLSAIAVNQILSPFAKVVTQKAAFERRRFRVSSSLTSEHTILAYAIVGVLLSVSIFGGVAYSSNIQQQGRPDFAAGSVSTGTEWTDWQTAASFIRNVLPSYATIASWWDYGYWINSAAGGRTIVDNATFNSTQIALMGYALMALNLTESLKTFHRWNASHVLVYWGHRTGVGGDDGKWPWMVRIAEDRFGSSLIDDATYLGDNPSTPTEEEEWTTDAFFQSTLYKLMLYGEPRDTNEISQMGLSQARAEFDNVYLNPNNVAQYEQDSRWASSIPSSLYGAFEPVFISSTRGTVKIYKIDYTMLYQYQNKTAADWQLEKASLSSVRLNGNISSEEKAFRSYDVVFGGGYNAKVYTRANATHIYYGIEMAEYVFSDDALGIQLAPRGVTSNPDIHVVGYNGNPYYDGHVDYSGKWTADVSGANVTRYAAGNRVVEFLLPLQNHDVQDLYMAPGMNYEIRLLFWNNIRTGEPTFASSWKTFWVPVDLY